MEGATGSIPVPPTTIKRLKLNGDIQFSALSPATTSAGLGYLESIGPEQYTVRETVKAGQIVFDG